MSRLRRCTAAVLVMSLAGVAVCVGQQKKEERKSTDIQVWAIRATTKNKEISKELRELADKLKKDFKFTGFKLEQKASGSAALDKAYNATLTGGYQANVTPKSIDGKQVKLQVQVLKGKDSKLNTTVTVKAGQFQLLGGMSLDGGDQLIVAVSAK
jgi:hypothetical protein